MSTNINISVGDNKLLEQARLQQAASRQAQLEKEANQRLEAQATAERTKALAAQGKDANGNPLYGVPTAKPDIDRRPAANRISEYMTGGVFTRARRLNEITPYWEEGQSPYGNAAPYDLVVEIAASDSNDPTVFILNRPQPGPLFYQGDGSGAPSLPPLAQLDIEESSEAAAAAAVDAVQGITNVVNIQNFTNGADMSGFFYLPDGEGGVIIMYYINVWYSTDAYELILRRELTYTKFWTIVGVVGEFGQTYKEFNINPGCTLGGFYGAAPVGQTEYLGREEITYTVSKALETKYYDNALFCFHVDKYKNIKQITTPAGLLSKFQLVAPPVQPNKVITTTIGANFLKNRLRFIEPTGTFGQGGQGACIPDSFTYDSGDQFDTYEINYDFFDQNLYDSYTSKVNVSLIYYFGLIPASGSANQIWGPSFGAFLLKGIGELNMSNSIDYDYMEKEYYNKKPAFFVSYCRVESCAADAVYWDYSKQRPSTHAGDLDDSAFKRSAKMGKVSLLPSAEYQQYMSRVFYYDFGLPAYCRQIVSSLGFSP